MKLTILERVVGQAGPTTCPTCQAQLSPVRYPSGRTPLSRDQWEGSRAGDWWCMSCPDNGRGKNGAYYWDKEVRTADLVIEPGVIQGDFITFDDQGVYVSGHLLPPASYLVEDPVVLISLATCGLRPRVSLEMGNELMGAYTRGSDLGSALLERLALLRQLRELLELVQERSIHLEPEGPARLEMLLDPETNKFDLGDIAHLKLELDKALRPYKAG